MLIYFIQIVLHFAFLQYNREFVSGIHCQIVFQDLFNLYQSFMIGDLLFMIIELLQQFLDSVLLVYDDCVFQLQSFFIVGFGDSFCLIIQFLQKFLYSSFLVEDGCIFGTHGFYMIQLLVSVFFLVSIYYCCSFLLVSPSRNLSLLFPSLQFDS